MQRTESAQKILQIVAQKVQQEVHNHLSMIVTKSLQAIFGNDCEFKIIFEQKRGRTEASLVFRKGKIEISPLEDSGGMMEIAAIALRLACLMIQKPQKRHALILDEPFRAVSKENKANLTTLIEELSTDLNMQFILVTHDEEFMIGNVQRLK